MVVDVIVVLDPAFGDRIEEIAARGPVWVVESSINTPVIRDMWRTQPHVDHREVGAITSCPVSDTEARVDNLLHVLADVEIHHGSADGAELVFVDGFKLEIVGVDLSREVLDGLREYGFHVFADTPDGFTAEKVKG